jgi:hypothetical protein
MMLKICLVALIALAAANPRYASKVNFDIHRTESRRSVCLESAAKIRRFSKGKIVMGRAGVAHAVNAGEKLYLNGNPKYVGEYGWFAVSKKNGSPVLGYMAVIGGFYFISYFFCTFNLFTRQPRGSLDAVCPKIAEMD